ncbi:GNAT family N-acetyltransferase [Tepidiforma sp.]|jgi:GNAT superfamily N-acetyltransferase|uniref:GNAT family N-acetyltransferase n=1 Tax=Tepidiforma sp. TaxID=2682230 RepID=UPI0026243F0A|nr:GNAT family N-acetyltransferase [Tepidiforma sp.]MCX7617547.1 GNAT family N-acetyltransferase [Tepidiforma sp.]
MAGRLQVRPLDESDAEACGELLAARHRRDRARLPYLEPGLEEPGAAAGAVRHLLGRPGAGGVAAVRGGRIAGFCIGLRLTFSAADFASQFLPLRSAVVPVAGHAVTPGEDATEVYRLLYAALAAAWVREGVLVHRVHLVPGDAAAEEAWVSLGFGRATTAGTRETARPVDGAAAASVRVDQATPEDFAAVRRLSRELAAHHQGSPMFWPPVIEAGAALDGFLQASLAGPVPTFLAWDGDEAVGMQLFLVPGFTPEHVRQDQRLYLFEGVVSAAARGSGVGTALLRASMAWAAANGHELCTLHWASGNYLGAPFWLGHGFVPVEHTMERRIDERALWGRAEPGHTG